MLPNKEIAIGLVWLGLCLGGMYELALYATTPGHSAIAKSASQLPIAIHDATNLFQPTDKLPLAKDGMTLVMAVHPQCPCSKTSIDNLAEIMRETHNGLKAYAVFVRPSGFSDSWTKSKLYQQAAKIPNVVPIVDNDGQLSKRFGALTSGQTYLYNAKGEQLFAGGITFGRGHAGENDGMDFIISTVRGESVSPVRSPVYGCSLFSCSASTNPSITK